MSFNVQSNIQGFRRFANELRNPSPYYPVVTEAKGVVNLVLGSMQLLVSQYMKYSSNPYLNGLATRHVQIGKEAMHRGAVQLVPGLLASMAAVYLIKRTN